MSQNSISTTAPSTTLSADSGNPPISPTPTRAKTFPSMRPSRASVAQGPSSGRIDLGTVYLGFYTRVDPNMPAEVQNGDEWTLVSLKKQLKPGSQELEAGTQILVNSIASSRCDLKSTYDDHKKPKPSVRKKWCWKLESDGKSFEVFPQDEDEGATMQSVANIIGIDQASMARFWIKAKMCLGEETEDPTSFTGTYVNRWFKKGEITAKPVSRSSPAESLGVRSESASNVPQAVACSEADTERPDSVSPEVAMQDADPELGMGGLGPTQRFKSNLPENASQEVAMQAVDSESNMDRTSPAELSASQVSVPATGSHNLAALRILGDPYDAVRDCCGTKRSMLTVSNVGVYKR